MGDARYEENRAWLESFVDAQYDPPDLRMFMDKCPDTVEGFMQLTNRRPDDAAWRHDVATHMILHDYWDMVIDRDIETSGLLRPPDDATAYDADAGYVTWGTFKHNHVTYAELARNEPVYCARLLARPRTRDWLKNRDPGAYASLSAWANQ